MARLLLNSSSESTNFLLNFALLLSLSSVSGHVFDLIAGSTLISAPRDSFSSFFGFSLDFLAPSKIVVGAPDADNGAGAMFVCDIDTDKCVANNFDDSNEPEMLGASVLVVNQSALACAPRYSRPYSYTWPGQDTAKTYNTMPGRCLMVDVDMSRDEFVPLDGSKVFFGRREVGNNYAYGAAYGAAGFAMTNFGQNVVIGAPGAWNWTGTVVLSDVRGNSKQMSQPWSPWVPRLNDYTGFALENARIGESSYLLLGSPRSGSPVRTGSVFAVWPSKSGLRLLSRMEGRQLGEYFGSAVVAVDLDGDQVDEVVVGAPLFSSNAIKDFSKANVDAQSYDEGRISIHAWDGSAYVERVSIFGQKSRARFGAAVAEMGDLDHDGRDDFVVSAPFEDDGKGVVRLYLGAQNIAAIQGASQVLRVQGVQGFGLGLLPREAPDIDNNGVPDLIIGSKGHAVVIRARPSVSVEISLRSVPGQIDLSNIPENIECEVCATLRSSSLLPRPATLQAKLKWTLDKRIVMIDSKEFEKEIDLMQNEPLCRIAIKTRFRENYDLSYNEVPLQLSVELTSSPYSSSSFCSYCGILDPRLDHSEIINVPFHSGCSEGICRSDAFLEARIDPSSFLIGSDSTPQLVLEVGNARGEPYFRPKLLIAMPQGIKLRKQPAFCHQKEGKESLVLCDVRGPLVPGDAAKVLRLELDASGLWAGMDELVFDQIELFSDSPNAIDIDSSNNKARASMLLRSEVDVEVRSAQRSSELIIFNQTKNDDGEIELMPTWFEQNFQIRKYLTSPVKRLTVKAEIPHYYGRTQCLVINRAFLQFSDDSVKPCFTSKMNNENLKELDSKLSDYFNCSTFGVQCISLECPSFALQTNSETATLSASMTLLPECFDNFDLIKVASMAAITMPYSVEQSLDPKLNLRSDVAEYITEFVDPELNQLGAMAIWQIVLAIVLALLILLSLLVCLVKCGFFARKRRRQRREQMRQEELEQLHGFESPQPDEDFR